MQHPLKTNTYKDRAENGRITIDSLQGNELLGWKVHVIHVPPCLMASHGIIQVSLPNN